MGQLKYNNVTGLMEVEEGTTVNDSPQIGDKGFENYKMSTGNAVHNINQKYNYNRPYNMSDVAGPVVGNEFTQYTKENLNPQGIEGTNVARNKGNFNLLDYLPFGDKSIMGGIARSLPKMDPRQVALRGHYKTDDIGRVAQGELMAGYNPVSGGLLNTITGGKFGDPTNYGLQRAYDKRLSTIDKTLAKWEADEEKYGERLKTTQLYARRKALQKAKADELAMLNNVTTTNQGGAQITDDGTGDGQQWITKKDKPHHGDVAHGTGGRFATPNQGGQTTQAAADKAGGSELHSPFYVGGRVGYNRGRVVNPGGYQGDEFEDENIFEFMQDQGVPHSQMVEGKSPFEMRIDELMDTGMSWQEAYEIAAQEFGQIAEGGDSFSEEGIASIV